MPFDFEDVVADFENLGAHSLELESPKLGDVGQTGIFLRDDQTWLAMQLRVPGFKRLGGKRRDENCAVFGMDLFLNIALALAPKMG